MALKFGFFNSVNGDRKYNADDMSKPYFRIVSNGVFADANGTTGFKVEPHSGLQIKVNSGNGIFSNKWCEMTANEIITVPTPNVTYPRIDTIVLRVDSDNRNMTLAYIQGTAASSPQKPVISRTPTITDYRLANITVSANATIITASNIEDTRYGSECGIVSNLLQNSDLTSMFSQWESQFDDWKNQLNESWNNDTAFKSNAFEEAQNARQENYEGVIGFYEYNLDSIREAYSDLYDEVEADQTEFNEWVAEKKAEFDEIAMKEVFFNYSNVYTADTDNETSIPINISAFSGTTDILFVYVNGLRLIPNVDYTLNGFESITLTKGVDAGTVISFFVLKTVVASDVEYISTTLQRVINLIPAGASETNQLADKAYVDSVSGGGGVDNSQIEEKLAELEDAILVANPEYTEMLWEQIQDGATETPISTPERIEEIWNAINESSGGNEVTLNLNTPSIHFTYVIDSDQKLTDWANNVEGNDYTSVLIRKGEWTSFKVVNLTTAGTKVVVGEAGSKLIFNGNVNGLFYDVPPTTGDYYMNGVNIEGVSVGSCFENCINLTNCTAVCTILGTSFESCSNLTNCTGVGMGGVNGYAFNKCNNLTNCNGTATGDNNGYGFYNCSNLTNCTGVGKGSYMPAGFRNCVSLTNCKGTGEGGTNGYGFQGSTLVSKCKAGGKSTSRVFETSYASSAKTSDYVCADTPAGGFNDPTNPTA